MFSDLCEIISFYQTGQASAILSQNFMKPLHEITNRFPDPQAKIANPGSARKWTLNQLSLRVQKSFDRTARQIASNMSPHCQVIAAKLLLVSLRVTALYHWQCISTTTTTTTTAV